MSDTLLIVDDDPAIITGLQALLEGDWEVRTAMNGRDARAAFAAFSPDVALLDDNLPDVSGLELLHDLKMYSEAVAVIMMSGQGPSTGWSSRCASARRRSCRNRSTTTRSHSHWRK